jgi:putative transposase
MGSLLAVVVHAANIHDTKSGIAPAKLAFDHYPSIKKFCADAGYRRTFVLDVDQILGLGVDI